MRRLLAFWLALVPVQPALAELAPAASEAAVCSMHACRCRTPAERRQAPRPSCHESRDGYVSAACTHDPVAIEAPAGIAPFLVSAVPAPVVLAFAALVGAREARPAESAFAGLDPPPPRPAVS